jgi:hypothetical protein
MADLDQLLAAAERADGATRINFREDIAACGVRAIRPMTDWLADDRLGAFAVRVLERIARDPSTRSRVIGALADADRTCLSPPVIRDVDAALLALRPKTASVQVRRPAGQDGKKFRPPELPPNASLEERFHQAMLDIYWLAGEASGYWASYFLRAVRNKGGLAEARHLLRMTGTSDGFERLTTERRLDLSMEALVVDPRFSSLFTSEEIAVARTRLIAAGFDPDIHRRDA